MNLEHLAGRMHVAPGTILGYLPSGEPFTMARATALTIERINAGAYPEPPHSHVDLENLVLTNVGYWRDYGSVLDSTTTEQD